MALVGLGGEFLNINRKLCDILGYEPEALVGLTFQDVTHPEDLQADRDQVRRLLAGELEAYSTEKRYVRRDDSIVRARLTVSVVRGPAGEALYVSGVEEVTGSEPFERSLKESEARFRYLVQNSSDIIALLKPDGRVAYVSPAMERVLGRAPQDRIGHSAFELMHPEDAERARQLFREGLMNPGVPLSIEVRMRHGDGSWRHMEVTGTNLLSEPIIEGIVVNTRDITERKRAEEELRAANEELKAFSYSVSHDLRAPLRSIDGFSLILLEDHQRRLDEVGRDYLRRVRAASQRMHRLIDDLLDLARVTSAELRRERVYLSALAREVSEELLRGDPAREVAFAIQKELEVEGDPRLLRIVLENLLGNAFKFTRYQSNAKIEVGFDADSGAYRVRDNGAGFEMAHAENLFVPFSRLHREEEFDGTGIGLATVARIVRRHGGTVWAEGEPGEGAVVYFTLSL
jgi:PAS domain S-box-containing protein